jgi:hypothetical protein
MFEFVRPYLCAGALLLGAPQVLAAELAFSVDRWPCGTNPKVGLTGASADWAGGVLTVRFVATEIGSTVIAATGAVVEPRGNDVILSYTEQQKPSGQAPATCAAPAVLSFVVSGLERKPDSVSVMARRALRQIAVEG